MTIQDADSAAADPANDLTISFNDLDADIDLGIDSSGNGTGDGEGTKTNANDSFHFGNGDKRKKENVDGGHDEDFNTFSLSAMRLSDDGEGTGGGGDCDDREGGDKGDCNEASAAATGAEKRCPNSSTTSASTGTCKSASSNTGTDANDVAKGSENDNNNNDNGNNNDQDQGTKLNFTVTSSPIRTSDADTNTSINDTTTATSSSNGNAIADNTNIHKAKRYVTPQDFDLLKVIGMGAFGKVLQVKNKQSNQILAMKVISKRLLKRKSTYIENIHAEREILTKINHPFIVTMHCSFQTKEKLFIIMDFLAGGELFLRLGRQGIFLEKTAAFYIAEIILALEHLHSRGILHRDLKPENILLSTDGHLCLTDFGLAKDFRWDDDDTANVSGNSTSNGDGKDGKALTVCGTQEYMAPEMVARKGYGKAADWWSLGCISYEMLSGNPPFESRKGAKDLFRKIMNERVRMPDCASASACVLLKGLLNKNATARLGAARGTMFQVGGVAQVKQLDFFKGIDWGLLEQKKVEPPERLEVDHEEDVRHFYDEFTTMGLPRSVIEMSHDNFKPRRCKSGAFRGFSFIQDDFVLPDRSEEHVEQYWNNIDEDGESLSDCASSLGGGGIDEDTFTTQKAQRGGNMTTALDSMPEVPVKKKRPPRKKKKKQQQQVQVQVQKQQQEKYIQSEPKEKETIVGAMPDQRVKDDLSYQELKPTHEKNDNSNTKEPLLKEQSISLQNKHTSAKSTDTTAKNTTTAWETVKKPKKVPEPTWETVRKPKKALEPAWETVQRKEAPLAMKNSHLIGSSNFVIQPVSEGSNNNRPLPTASNYLPKSSRSTAAQWGTKIPVTPAPQLKSNNNRVLGVSGASDWRNQPLKRNTSSSARNLHAGSSPGSSGGGGWPSLSASSNKDKAIDWPSLGGGASSAKRTTPSTPQSVISKSQQRSSSPWTTKNNKATSRTTNAWGK